MKEKVPSFSPRTSAIRAITLVACKYRGMESSHRVRVWQALNSHVLALTPKRWDSLDAIQKWVLLRTLAVREDYVPDWIDPAIWASLRSGLDISNFNTDTELLADSSAWRLREAFNPHSEQEAAIRTFGETVGGESSQSWREA